MAAEFYDQLETRDPESRALAQFALLPDLIRRARELAPGWAEQWRGVKRVFCNPRFWWLYRGFSR